MDVYLARHGAGDPVLLLLHGLGATGEVWDGLVSSLAGRWPGEILVADLPGHGRSAPLARYSFGALTAALAGALEPGRPVAVLGHSLGGVVGLALASGWFGVPVPAVCGLGIKVAVGARGAGEGGFAGRAAGEGVRDARGGDGPRAEGGRPARSGAGRRGRGDRGGRRLAAVTRRGRVRGRRAGPAGAAGRVPGHGDPGGGGVGRDVAAGAPAGGRRGAGRARPQRPRREPGGVVAAGRPAATGRRAGRRRRRGSRPA